MTRDEIVTALRCGAGASCEGCPYEVKECLNEKTQWSGTQTLITPKGRETFRLLYPSV